MLHIFLDGEAVTEKELREILVLAMFDEGIAIETATNIVDSYSKNEVMICLGQRGRKITFNNTFWRF